MTDKLRAALADALLDAPNPLLSDGHHRDHAPPGGYQGYAAGCIVCRKDIDAMVTAILPVVVGVRAETFREAAELIDAQPLCCATHDRVDCREGCPYGSDILREAADEIGAHNVLPTEWGWSGWDGNDPDRAMALRDEQAARQVVADHPGTRLVHRPDLPWRDADTTS